MRRSRAFKRGRAVTILLAGGIGYLLGDWHAITLRSADLSPAQNVAIRFPEARTDAVVADAAPDMPTSAAGAMVLGAAQFVLLSPEPMVPQAAPHAERQTAMQTAAPREAASSPPAPPSPPPAAVPARRPVPAPMQPRTEVKSTAMEPRAELKSAADGASRRADRPGFMLNDAQIASIKQRLHLTPDQARMWPAVEAALRNVAYAKARGAPARAATVASLDPDSAEVQGLKSAAFPLIMSFSDEQRNEVRSLAHVMGLDRLASEF